MSNFGGWTNIGTQTQLTDVFSQMGSFNLFLDFISKVMPFKYDLYIKSAENRGKCAEEASILPLAQKAPLLFVERPLNKIDISLNIKLKNEMHGHFRQ